MIKSEPRINVVGTTKGMEVIEQLYAYFLSERPLLLEQGSDGWVSYGSRNGKIERICIESSFDKAYEAVVDCFKPGYFIVEHITDDASPDYSSLKIT